MAMQQEFKLPSYKDFKWDDVSSSSFFADAHGKMFYPNYISSSIISWLPLEFQHIERQVVKIEVENDNKYLYKIVHWTDGAQIWYKIN